MDASYRDVLLNPFNSCNDICTGTNPSASLRTPVRVSRDGVQPYCNSCPAHARLFDSLPRTSLLRCCLCMDPWCYLRFVCRSQPGLQLQVAGCQDHTRSPLCATPLLKPLLCLLQVKPQEVELVRRDYVANGGWETFLSYEDPRQDILVGLLRLRQVGSPTSISAPQMILPQLLACKTPQSPLPQHNAPDPQYMLAS